MEEKKRFLKVPISLQCNGGSTGLRSSAEEAGYVCLSSDGDRFAYGLTLERLERMVRWYVEHGTLLIVPTIITTEWKTLLKNLEILRQAYETEWGRKHLLPCQLEGPWLNPLSKGAHKPERMRLNGARDIDQLLDIAAGNISIVALAPEMEGGIEFIEKLRELKIVPTMAHHAADVKTMNDAIAAGAMAQTHCFNGMPKHPDLKREHFFALFEAWRARLFTFVVSDGVHVTDAQLQTLWSCVGASNLIVTADEAPCCQMPPGDYEVFTGCPVRVVEETADGRPGFETLAGSYWTHIDCVRHLAASVTCDDTQIWHVASYNAQRLLKEPLERLGKPFRETYGDLEGLVETKQLRL